MATLTDMMSKFVSANTASSSGSGTLPDNTITNPKEELKALIGNKEKLSEMARTTMNKHCFAVILNQLPRKLGDPGKFLIPCEFPRIDECLALPDLGASINLMPLSVWKALSLPELTPTCMTPELVDRSVSKPIGIAKDVSFKVGTSRALIDVHKGELTLRIENEAITYNLDQTVRYSANYNQMTANKIDVIESACEEHSQEVLGFSNVTTSGTLTPHNDPIVSATSPTLTLFGDIDFLLFEEADAFLGLEDDPDSLKINPFYYDHERDILLLEAILNSEPSPPLSNQEQNLPSFEEELKANEAQTVKSSVDEPPEVELKDLPHHLEYAFLKGDNKLPVIIAKELGSKEKSTLIKVLKSHKRAVAWNYLTFKSQYFPLPSEVSVTRRWTKLLADRSVSKPIGIAKDVSFKVGVFHFPADFVVVDFEPDPRVSLILGRCFLKTSRALIDVHKGELTLRIGNEAITYKLDQTVRSNDGKQN
nr:reverse transcriptase domain-containing protein [Tanacetum cinerariifolium]